MSPLAPTPTSQRVLPLLAVWGTVIFWGLSFVSSKTILNTGVPPMTMVCIRFVIATVVLNLFVRKFDPTARLRRKDVLPLAASGMFPASTVAHACDRAWEARASLFFIEVA